MDSLYRSEWCFPYQEEEEESEEDDETNRHAKRMREHHSLNDEFFDPDYEDYDGLVFTGKPLKKGDCCDLDNLLFTKARDYLIRCQDGEEVKAADCSLGGKFVLIVGFFIPVLKDDKVAQLCRSLIETYNEFRKTNMSNNDFEVVMAVMLRQDLKYSTDVAQAAADFFISGFPWLAVPFMDTTSCARIFQALDLRNYHYPACALLNIENREVLQHGNPSFLFKYGTDSYPFTDERINAIKQSDAQVRRTQPKLETFLGCSPDRVLERISGGEKSVAELGSDEIVALYLCAGGEALHKLYDVHRECKKQGHKFEVVVVFVNFNVSRDWHSFQMDILKDLKMYLTTDWFVFPYCEKASRRLWRSGDCSDRDSMIVVGPGGSYFDHYALNVLSYFGSYGFPFSRKVLTENIMRRLRGLSLKSLFGGQKLYKCGGSDHPTVVESVSTLEGRNFIVCFDSLSKKGPDAYQVWPRMLDWYKKVQEKHEDFEVVFVCSSLLDGASFEDECQKFPWMFVPYDLDFAATVIRKARVFHDDWGAALFAFGKNGGIQSIHAERYDWPGSYDEVFSGQHLDAEVIGRLRGRNHYWLREA